MTQQATTSELTHTVHDEDLPLPVRLEAARTISRLLEDAKKSINRTVGEMVEGRQLDPDTLATLYWEYEDIVPSRSRCKIGIDSRISARSLLLPVPPEVLAAVVELPVVAVAAVDAVEDAVNRAFAASFKLITSCW